MRPRYRDKFSAFNEFEELSVLEIREFQKLIDGHEYEYKNGGGDKFR